MPAENGVSPDGDQTPVEQAGCDRAGPARWEQERALTIEFFRLVNAATGSGDLVDSAVRFFQQHSTCEAVAIRLREGSDFPYFRALGFPPEFIRLENSLCSQDCFGEVVRDSAGEPVVECRCGDVICGHIDSSKPWFTALGSFWTNSAIELRTTNVHEVRQTRKRGHCSESGYESIALIPLKAGGERLGLIQFNDKRRGLFSPEKIAMWEMLGDFLAVALARLRAEEKLRESEERTRSLFESVSDALAVHGITPDGEVGRFLEANDLFCKLLGYSLEEMLSLSPSDLDDPSSGISALYIGKRLVNNEDVLFEQILIAKDGTRVPVEIHARPFLLRGKSAVIATIRGISERKRAERALHESEQRLSQAVNVAGLGIFEHEHPVDVIHCSPVFRQLHGWSPDQVITSDVFLESVFPEDREMITACIRNAVDPKGSGLACCEHRIVRPDGIRWLSGRSETFFEGEGEARHAVRTVGAMQDITERKQAELELRASQQQLRTAMDAAKLGIWSRDMDSTVVTCDDLTRSFFGWESGQVITFETLLNSIVPEDRERFLEKRDELMSGGENADRSVEYRIQQPDGSIRWVTVRRNMVYDNAGQPTRLIGVVRDITHRKQAEEEKLALEQQFLHAQKMEAVGRLAGGIAHDFNNILMVIRSYAEITQECLPEQDKLRKNIQAIMKAADRAASLTGQMLAFSRKQVLSPVPLNLSVAVSDAAKMIHRLIGEDIELKMFPESTWTVRADPDQISQVLMNLSVNARDAMPEGGALSIATSNVTVSANSVEERSGVPPGDYAVFSVGDTGTGIARDIQERMFEPFFTTKSIGKGTGLGLSTVYGIVNQSGGYLLVDSALGHGSCFTIYLPRVKDAVVSAAMMNAEWLQGGTETLLVVEDEDALRGSIGEFLGGLGYTVLSAESGHKALEITGEFDRPIDLMVTDVVMPKMSGRELAQILESRRPALKTIFMSGYTDDLIVRHGVQEEGVVFLQKPFSLSTLARKIREVLGPSANPAQN
jgi:PAS domain S-box-containing protein